MAATAIDYRKIFAAQLGVPPGAFMDCYAFSVHKSGSSLMHTMISHVCRIARIPGVSIPDTLFLQGIFEKDWSADPGVCDLIGRGRLYYGFRAFPKVLASESVRLRDKKCILLVRDPRDALVSQYYSFGGKHLSHKRPVKNGDAWLERAKASEGLSIDEYVLEMAPQHRAKLLVYKRNLNFDKVLLRHYEDVYFDKRTFLGEIFDHFGIEVPPKILDDVASRNDIRPEVEDPSQHIRKGTPGDHVEKLKPETIDELNQIFRPIGAGYGYDLH